MIITITLDTDKARPGTNEVSHERPDKYDDTALDGALNALIRWAEQWDNPQPFVLHEIVYETYDGKYIVGKAEVT